VVPELPDPIGWHLKTPVVAINPLQFRRLRDAPPAGRLPLFAQGLELGCGVIRYS
jgi:hypothetical protein